MHPSQQQPGHDGEKEGKQLCAIIVTIPGCKVGTFPFKHRFCLFLPRFWRVSSIKHELRAECVWTGCFLPIRDPSGVSDHGECGHLFPHCFAECVNSTYHPLTHLQHLCFRGTKHISTKGIKEHRLFLSFSQQSSSNGFFFPLSEKAFQKNEMTSGFIKSIG